MRLVKNQNKYNITGMEENELKQVLMAVGYFNSSHTALGKGFMCITITCDKQNDVITNPEYLQALRDHKVINTPKSVQS